MVEGSGTTPVMGTTSRGEVPHVTVGIMSSPQISTLARADEDLGPCVRRCVEDKVSVLSGAGVLPKRVEEGVGEPGRPRCRCTAAQ